MSYKRKNTLKSNDINILNNKAKFKNPKSPFLIDTQSKVNINDLLAKKYNYKNSIHTTNIPFKTNSNLSILNRNLVNELSTDEIEDIKAFQNKTNINNTYTSSKKPKSTIRKGKKHKKHKLDNVDTEPDSYTNDYSDTIDYNNQYDFNNFNPYKSKLKSTNKNGVSKSTNLNSLSEKQIIPKVEVANSIPKSTKNNKSVIISETKGQDCNIAKINDKSNTLKHLIKQKTPNIKSNLNTITDGKNIRNLKSKRNRRRLNHTNKSLQMLDLNSNIKNLDTNDTTTIERIINSHSAKVNHIRKPFKRSTSLHHCVDVNTDAHVDTNDFNNGNFEIIRQPISDILIENNNSNTNYISKIVDINIDNTILDEANIISPSKTHYRHIKNKYRKPFKKANKLKKHSSYKKRSEDSPITYCNVNTFKSNNSAVTSKTTILKRHNPYINCSEDTQNNINSVICNSIKPDNYISKIINNTTYPLITNNIFRNSDSDIISNTKRSPNNINTTSSFKHFKNESETNNYLYGNNNYPYGNKYYNDISMLKDYKQNIVLNTSILPKYNYFNNILNTRIVDKKLRFKQLTYKSNILYRYSNIIISQNSDKTTFKNKISNSDLENINTTFTEAINTHMNLANIIEKKSALSSIRNSYHTSLIKNHLAKKIYLNITDLKSKKIVVTDQQTNLTTIDFKYHNNFKYISNEYLSHSIKGLINDNCYKSKIIDSSSKNMIINNLKKHLNLVKEKKEANFSKPYIYNALEISNLKKLDKDNKEYTKLNLEVAFDEQPSNNFATDYDFKINGVLSKALSQNKNPTFLKNIPDKSFKPVDNLDKVISNDIKDKIIKDDTEKYNNKFSDKSIKEDIKPALSHQNFINSLQSIKDKKSNFKSLVIDDKTKYKLGNNKFDDIKNQTLSRNISLIKFKISKPLMRFKNDDKSLDNLDFDYSNGAVALNIKQLSANTEILNHNSIITSLFTNSIGNVIEDKDDLGTETIIKTKNTIVRADKTIKNFKATKKVVTKVAKKSIKIAQETTQKAARAARSIVKVLTNPLVLKGIGITLLITILCICIMLIMACVLSFVSSIVPIATTPVATEMTLNDLNKKIRELDNKTNNQIEELKNSSGYDDIVYKYNNDNSSVYTNMQDFLAILAIYTNQNIKDISPDELKEFHSLTYDISTETETFYCEENNCQTDVYEDGTVVEYCNGDHLRLIITLTTYTFDELMDKLDFDDKQKEWAYLMAKNDIVNFYPDVSSKDFPSNDRLNDKQIEELLKDAPTVSTSRRTIVETAGQLLGYTTYKWGAKANYTGGMPKQLDCSGFVDWVYRTSGIGNMLSGGGTAYQWGATYAIREDELEIGDLVFKQLPSQTTESNANHVGIYIGKDGNGKNLYIHCEYPAGVVINSYSGFKHFRRVPVNFN